MKKLFLSILVLGLLFSGGAYAHSGGTNSEGCHNQKSNNTYHCHKKKSYSKTNSSELIKVIDGDTIHIGEKKYRFSGIDTPEKKQTCELNGNLILCGMIAKEILEKKIANNKVDCIEESIDFFKRIVAECFVNGESLSSYMVRSGYAFAYIKYSKKFVKDEEFAKEKNLGLWKGDFVYPWNYRNN
jgi:endonuclease YncB( thermonuclease family)